MFDDNGTFWLIVGLVLTIAPGVIYVYALWQTRNKF
jgi:hypothetical protein